MQENWIGRSEGLAVRFRWRRPARRPGRASRSTRPGRTRCSARASWRSSPDHPLADGGRREGPGGRRLRRGMPARGTTEAEIETAEKIGYDTGLRVKHPFDPNWKLPVWVANFVLMDYGTGAIFGCPAHDQRDLDFARKYGLPVKPVVLPPGQTPDDLHGRRRGLSRRRAALQFRLPRRPDVRRQGRGGARLETQLLDGAPQGRRDGRITGCATGASRASATGAARSRSSTARNAASCRCRRPICRCALPDDVDFDEPGNPLDRHPTWKHVACPIVRRPGRARDRHDGHVRRLVLVFRPLHQSAAPRADRQGGGRLLAARRPVYRRRRARGAAPALFALLQPGAARRPAMLRPATSRSRACSRRAW